MERSVLLGLAAFRWATWVWMAIVLVLARGNLVRPGVAVGLVLAALLVTAWSTADLVRDPRLALAPPLVGAEVAVALGLQFADGVVFRAPHVFTTQQPLGVGWPTAAVLSSGVAFGPVVGAVTGVATGLARSYSAVLALAAAEGTPVSLDFDGERSLSLVTSVALYAFAGAAAGYAMDRIREAEARITTAERDLADARAREAVAQEREELARRLHDGVLQTLALVERRTEDPALSRLARVQERELRHYLFAAGDERLVGRGMLGDALREAGDRCELAAGLRVAVLVPDDVPALPSPSVEALAGAVGEALTNVSRHARTDHAVVAVEPLVDDGVVVSVRDDGVGFDLDTTPEGVGRARSIRGRLQEVGGTATWITRPGHGCEVRLRVPPPPPPGPPVATAPSRAMEATVGVEGRGAGDAPVAVVAASGEPPDGVPAAAPGEAPDEAPAEAPGEVPGQAEAPGTAPGRRELFL